MATATQPKSNALEVPNPEFVEKILQDYRAKVAHVFVVSGNVNDFSDDSGTRSNVLFALVSAFDDNVRNTIQLEANEKGRPGLQANPTVKTRELIRVCAAYNLSTGLEFFHESSKNMWMDAIRSHYGAQEVDNNWPANWHSPVEPGDMFAVVNKWFKASKAVAEANVAARLNNIKTKQELLFSIVFTDADSLFPDGNIASLSGDRAPIVHIRNWARSDSLGGNNRIVLMTRHLSEIHESIRGGSSGVVTMSVPKPNIVNREAWLHSFADGVIERVETSGRPMRIGNRNVTQVELAEGFDFHQFAVQSAGMSRRQMEDVIMKSWLTGQPVDYQLVRERKQRALEDEYQGIVDFYEPEHGFEHIGGHSHLKKYFQRKVIIPLKNGDRRLCTSGMLMTGPPGTGKTAIAKALAKEAKMNFMIAHLDKLFDGLVGGTETKTRKFLEAVESAAPVIVFLDEMDSVLSSGRQSNGDSGTSARVFNAIMQFLSDESRKGRVVVIGASNRPDLLDGALIRSGRFDAKIPALPPAKGDSIGRLSILAALCRKHAVKFDPALGKTEDTANEGLGRLLLDNERIWTGAEIEVVLKEAFDNAAFAMRVKKGAPDYTITLPDWNQAYNDILPNTQEVERMTKLSLLYVDHLGYCPDEWKAMAKDKNALRQELGLQVGGGLEED
jgi:ATP-dependent 26S proteasome regulatory subunit